MSDESLLWPLRDIEGVYGSAVIDDHGAVSYRDVPETLSDHLLALCGERLSRMWNSLPEGDVPRYLLLEFSDFKLFVAQVMQGNLCVFVTQAVNVPALEMAAQVVAREVAQRAASLPSFWPRPTTGPIIPASSATRAESPASSQGKREKRSYVYRGVKFDA